MLPNEYETYYEPFIGGGALFLALNPKKAVINDFNSQLINLYKQCRDNKDELKNQLDKIAQEHLENGDEFYYQVREKYNDCISKDEHSIMSATYFLYLNKGGFNGLYRLNSKGFFNVPSGRKKKVNLYDNDNFEMVSELLKKTTILNGDFEIACKEAKKGDFVFFDSPYYNTFDTYQAGGFSEDDHKRLAKLFKELSGKGVYCMLTNSNEDFIKDLYKDYKIKEVAVKRMINRNGNDRTGEEVIIINY